MLTYFTDLLGKKEKKTHLYSTKNILCVLTTKAKNAEETAES